MMSVQWGANKILRDKIIRAMEVVNDMLREENNKIVQVRTESNSAWLCVDVWFDHPMLPPEMTEPVKFAIWLETALLYKVDPSGAVCEDPITVEEAVKGEWQWH